MEDNHNNSGMQIDINTAIEDGVYSNLAIISHSGSEFILDFLRLLPGKPQPKVASRIVIAPEHTKRLLMALRENIAKYEQAFGEIDLHESGRDHSGRTIAPFDIPKGEA